MKLTQGILWLWRGETIAAQRTRRALKLALLLFLFSILFWIVPFAKVVESLLSANLLYLIPGLLLGLVILYLGSAQLAILGRKQGITLKVMQFLAIDLSIKFYLLFLPGDLVGSGIRWYKVSQPDGKPFEGLATVAFSRLLETFLDVMLGFGFWLLAGRKSLQAGGWGFIFLIAVVTLFWFLATRLSSSISSWVEKYTAGAQLGRRRQAVLKVIEKILKAVATYADFSSWELLEVILIGIAQGLVGVVSMQLLAKSVGIDLSFFDMGWLRTIVVLAAMLPFAFAGGLGIREASLVVVLSTFGINPGLALAFSLLIFARSVFLSLLGGFIEAFQAIYPRQVT